MTSQKQCPFKVGDIVVYRPTDRGRAQDVMTASEKRLQPGASYKIAAIQRDAYILVEGDTHPGGGIYWTEFSAD